MRRIGIWLLVFTLVFSMNPVPMQGHSLQESRDKEKVILLSEEFDKDIYAYKTVEAIEQAEPDILIPNESIAYIYSSNEGRIEVKGYEYSYIQYTLGDTEDSIDVYVESNKVIFEENYKDSIDSDSFEQESVDVNIDKSQGTQQVTSNRDIIEFHKDEQKETDRKNTAQSEDKINDEMTTSKISHQSKSTITESKTSRLARIKHDKVKVYESIGGKSSNAGSALTDYVYYVKREAKYKDDTYYLLSTQPSASTGIIGWVNSSDVTSHSHKGVDKKSKAFIIKGNGNARSKAWGAKKDIIHSGLSNFAGQTFHVDLTERVGNNTWYRGEINGDGQTVWLHSSFLNYTEETKTSRLARIKNSSVRIYESVGGKSSNAGSKYTDYVYYVKRQAKHEGNTYYLLSTEPSASQGTIGWVSSTDVTSYSHKSVDKNSNTFYLKGNGTARSKAWGAKNDVVHSSLTQYTDHAFHVNLTERVGNNTWYRGKINGKGQNVWLHSNFLNKEKIESKTSRLARIKNSKVAIYDSIGGQSSNAGSKHTDYVYYVKRQAELGDNTYYLLSTEPSASRGTIGWVKSTGVSSHAHKSVGKDSKTLYIKGNGNARSKAWGAKKDIVYSSLTDNAGDLFLVNLKEMVGNNTWYRGQINGQGGNVWLHSNFVTDTFEDKTSRLARFKNNNAQIYTTVGGNSSGVDSSYLDRVYYVKRVSKTDGQTHYLLSEQPSASRGTIGWVNSTDVTSHSHKSVDKNPKMFIIKGNGNARSKAWGGKRDRIYSDLSKYKGDILHVNLTEKVGNNTWYRGKINGRGQNLWFHSNFLLSGKKTIVIDAGHGGSDPGATGNGLREKDLTLDISKRVERLLKNAGYTVIMTRSNDSYHSLKDRSKKANDSNADLFMSIHINSGGGRGIETWWNDKNSHPKDSEQLAKDVQSEIIKSTNASDRGVKGRGPKRGNFHVTREPKMPSALVEVGFIDTKSDADKLKDKNFLQKAAEGIVNGIKKFFGL